MIWSAGFVLDELELSEVELSELLLLELDCGACESMSLTMLFAVVVSPELRAFSNESSASDNGLGEEESLVLLVELVELVELLPLVARL